MQGQAAHFFHYAPVADAYGMQRYQNEVCTHLPLPCTAVCTHSCSSAGSTPGAPLACTHLTKHELRR